jgi:L-alanine-DL-glutamate epimerase-like enolase superfamily enzyme
MQHSFPTIEIPVIEVAAVVRRAPIPIPIKTSFGSMKDRPAVFLRVTDADGISGYGEIWCNFPTVAAEHRQRLAEEVVGPVLLALGAVETGSVYELLMERLHVLALQSGEWGPLRQVAAGLDAAVWDLAARRAGLPLYRLLNPQGAGRIRAYASGIGPEDPGTVARSAAARGHGAFKLKVGFGRDSDLRALKAFRAAMGEEAALMIDANQGWDVAEAADRAEEYAQFGLDWIEEPLRADRPIEEWLRVARRSPVLLAAGENIDTRAGYDAMAASGAIGFIQPDVAKWGGVSGCLAVAREAGARGLVYCPHFLGGGIGLLTSAHLLAAAGGGGMLEIDTNPNALREDLAGAILKVTDCEIKLPDVAGIGISPDHLFD